MEQKKSGRMAAVPQFTVPEIFVDDEDITEAQRGPFSASGSPLFSPVDTEWRASGSDAHEPSTPHGLRSRANSIQMTPLGSPIRTTPLSPIGSSPGLPPFSPPADGEWQFASALSRPPSPTQADHGLAEPTGMRSRQNSSVSAADVLEVLDNSAWGESIRRSFTQRRPSGR
jgi:hypothetical protein